VICALLAWCVFAAPRRAGFSMLGLLIMTSLGLHSLVDYPLRTMAMGIVFAFAAAVFFSRPEIWPGSGAGETSRARTTGRPAS
jgi:hypothetical protein